MRSTARRLAVLALALALAACGQKGDLVRPSPKSGLALGPATATPGTQSSAAPTASRRVAD